MVEYILSGISTKLTVLKIAQEKSEKGNSYESDWPCKTTLQLSSYTKIKQELFNLSLLMCYLYLLTKLLCYIRYVITCVNIITPNDYIYSLFWFICSLTVNYSSQCLQPCDHEGAENCSSLV